MAILRREDLRNQLKIREFAPVYLLFGPETYLRDLAAKTITDLALADSALREFNESQYSLNNTPLSRALGDAEQLPVMSPCRVVKITGLNISSAGKQENLSEDGERTLEKYLARPAETSIVILVADDFDKRRKISKLIAEKCVAVEFGQLKDDELITWANGKVKELGATAEDKAIRHLVALVGDNVRRLTNEIEKIAASALPDALITYELVESLVPNSREMTNFQLTDHLLAKDKTKTLQVLKKILDDGAEPLMLLGLIASSFRRLFLAKEMMIQGAERREILGTIRLPPHLHERFLASARRADRGALGVIIKKIGETDLAVKTSLGGGGKSGSRLQIEMLVFELLSSPTSV